MYLALEDALSYRDVDEESYSVRDKMHTVVVVRRSPSSIGPVTDIA
jgi:hypothetical protein